MPDYDDYEGTVPRERNFSGRGGGAGIFFPEEQREFSTHELFLEKQNLLGNKIQEIAN